MEEKPSGCYWIDFEGSVWVAVPAALNQVEKHFKAGQSKDYCYFFSFSSSLLRKENIPRTNLVVSSFMNECRDLGTELCAC